MASIRADIRVNKLFPILVSIFIASSSVSVLVVSVNGESTNSSALLPQQQQQQQQQANTTNVGESTNETTTTGGTLLSANEFVDFTEAPTPLFDGTSNDRETLSIIKESSPTTTTTETTERTTTVEPTISEPTTTVASEDDQDENEDEQPAAKEQFEPPQNVSQYMDYIESLFHDLRHQISDLFEPHLPQLIRSSQMVQLSGSCSYDMLRMALALRQFEPWALKMIDSSGKVPEGIFEGSFTALGSYDECLNTVFGQESSTSTTTTTTTTSQSQSQSQNQSQTQGKYCLVNVSPYLPPKPPADRVERMFQEEANRRNYTKDNQFSRLSPMFYYMKFRIGVCIPSTCTESDMDSLSEALSSSLRLNITIPNCRVRQYQPASNHQLVAGLVFGSVLALVFGATLMDYLRHKFDRQKRKVVQSLSGASVGDDNCPKQQQQQQQQEEDDEGDDEDDRACYKVSSQRRFVDRLGKNWSWLSFSLFTNYRLYFSSSRPAAGGGGGGGGNAQQIVRCLNGIRVISLCWVIVANSYITLDPRATKRLTKTREAPKDFLFQMVAQASLAIETFFFLSGVLMSMSFARKLVHQKPSSWCLSEVEVEAEQQSSSSGAKNNKSNHDADDKQEAERNRRRRWRWLQFYVHRYVRMTPATMLVIAFSMYAYGYGDGPLWFEATHKAHQSCSENWWRHLLHVANFIDTRQMCFIHYWYIAADMQLFLFAPLLLFLIYRYRKVGYALVTLIGAASIGTIFYTTYMRNLPPTLLFYNSDPESRREFGNTIMTKPLTHALPYLVGMLVGKWLTTATNQRLTSSSAEMTTISSSASADKSSGLNSQPPLSHNGPNIRGGGGGGGSSSSSSGLTSLLGGIAAVVALAEVFLPYKWNNSHLPTRLLASLYAAFFRFAWSLVLAYIIMSCRHRRSRRCRHAPVNDHQRQRQRHQHTRSSQRDHQQQTHNGMMINFANQPIIQCASCQSLDNVLINGSGSSGSQQRQQTMRKVAAGNIIMSSSSSAAAAAAPTNASARVGATSKLASRRQQRVAGANCRNDEWCLCGSGGNLVNRLLSLDVFTYLSRLSFVAYLIHLPLMSVFIAQTRGLFAFSHTLVIHLALSYLVMTFLLSFWLVHLIELPFLTFERYLFDRFLSASRRSHHHHHHQNLATKPNLTTKRLDGHLAEPGTFAGLGVGLGGGYSYTINGRMSVSEKL